MQRMASQFVVRGGGHLLQPDQEGVVRSLLHVNEAWERLFGWSQLELNQLQKTHGVYFLHSMLTRSDLRRIDAAFNTERIIGSWRTLVTCTNKHRETFACVMSITPSVLTQDLTHSLEPSREALAFEATISFEPLPACDAANPHNLFIVDQYLKRQEKEKEQGRGVQQSLFAR